jgi:hypothetical protein
MPTPGWGAEFGSNFGGGGVIYLTNLVPQPNNFIPSDQSIRFTIGVQAGLIDLSTVQITVSTHLAFDGSTATFAPDFAASTYSYSVADNGYSFVLLSDLTYPATVTIVVTANTLDGATTTQSYQVNSAVPVVYPPTPLNVPLNSVSIAKFSGEAQSGVLAGGSGQVFFSPALLVANTGSQLDVDSVEMTVHAADTYNADPTSSDNNRPFLWGPPPAVPTGRAFPPDMDPVNYLPVWNSWVLGPSVAPFGTLKTTQATATGVLTDIPTGDQTIILY